MVLALDPNKAVALEATFTTLSFLFLFLRLYVVIVLLRRFNISDFCVVIAYASLLLNAGPDFYLKRIGFWEIDIVFEKENIIGLDAVYSVPFRVKVLKLIYGLSPACY